MAKTPIRTLRVDPELWDAAKAKAQAEGTTVSEVLIQALRQYTGQDKVHRFPGSR
ncbi:hypothetical protein [Rhodococcus pyridinivorans]|jgi:predicted HicB family RNase H-like nuclease|uniref:hypothetical protein n=1 Tax=Rhodococcus pyridinivorans TaxID=103816 RepID=UPI0015860CB0|nr:hypothetical protein [Rhodococcus pyridinivorans]